MQDRFKFRVFSTTNKRYTDIGLSTALAANSVSNNQFVIQQCLGAKDKTSRLIYESDLVLVEEKLAEVVWYPYHCCFDILFQTDSPKDFDYEFCWNEFTVVGSIADNHILNLEGKIIADLNTVEDLHKLFGLEDN